MAPLPNSAHTSVPAGTALPSGFVPFPRVLLDRLLRLNLGRREQRLLLLIVRLTSGCRRRWANLRPADLAAIGIGANHARQCLGALLATGLIVRNEDTDEYALCASAPYLANPDSQTAQPSARLDRLVARHLAGTPNPRGMRLALTGKTPAAIGVSSAAVSRSPAGAVSAASPIGHGGHSGVYGSATDHPVLQIPDYRRVLEQDAADPDPPRKHWHCDAQGRWIDDRVAAQ